MAHRDQDPGNYKKTEGVARIICGEAACENGDIKLRNELLEQLDTVYHRPETSASGSMHNAGLSTYMKLRAVQARLLNSPRDWVNMMSKGVPEICFQGPLLASVPFPQVLVGKAWSHDGSGLELVLHNGAEPGDFTLDFERLKPGAQYKLNTGDTFQADNKGTAKASVKIDGRTVVIVERV